jgi:photosystem II stability/assembly factor-like uncharacterized protein
MPFKIFTTFLLICCTYFPIFAQWTQYKTPNYSLADGRIIQKDASTLYAQNSYFYVSHDLGSTWKKVSKAFMGVRDFLLQGNTLWVNDSGNIYKSDNEGAAWTRLTNIPITGRVQIEGMAVGSKDK